MIKNLFLLAIIFICSSVSAQDLTTCAGKWSVYMDGVLQTPAHTKETEAQAHFIFLQLTNPKSVVVYVGGKEGDPITCGPSNDFKTLLDSLAQPTTPPPDPQPQPNPEPTPIPPTIPPVSAQTQWRGIPDPSATFGFDVFANYPATQTITGPQGNKTLTCTGTAQSPCLIDASNATFTKLTISGQYVIVDGGVTQVTSTAREAGFVRVCSYCVIRNHELIGNKVNIGSSSAVSLADYSAWIGGEVHSFGDSSQGAPENDFHGFKIMGAWKWILNAEVYEMGGDSVQVGDASRGSAENIFIGGGYFHDNHENGVDIKDSTNVIASGIIMRGFAPSSSDPGAAVVVHDDAFNAQILDNTISDTRTGIVSSGVSGHVIDGNTVTASGTAIECRNTSAITITRNTLTAPKPFDDQNTCRAKAREIDI